MQTNTFLFPIPPNYLSGVKVIEQPCAEVTYEVDETSQVKVIFVSFPMSILRYVVNLEWMANDIYQAAINNAQPVHME